MMRGSLRAGMLGGSGILGATAVAAAAVAAHGPLASDLATTASHFQLFQALGVAVAALAPLPTWGHWAIAALFGLGCIGFAGGLYSLAWLGISWGPLVPIGGSLLILGWLTFAITGLRCRFAG